MDKTEISEQVAKVVVQSLLDNDIIRVIPITTNYLTMNPYITKEMLEKYIREEVLKYMENEELEFAGKMYSKERE